MKVFFLLLAFCIGFYASAQTNVSASAQQNVTFRLLPVTIIERVSANSTHVDSNTQDALLSAQTRQKWAVQLKKLTEMNEQSYAPLAWADNNHALPENISDVQLYTVSKP